MSRWRLVGVTRSARRGKKLTAVFESPSGRRLIRHFGAAGHGDYTLYWRVSPRLAAEKRRQYIARHGRGGEDWEDPTTPGALSRYLLWEKPTLREALAAFRARFSV